MANETNTGKSGPTVAVVIPTYKRKSKLERAVNSVYNQSYTDWKLYVVNDAPALDVGDVLPDDDRITCIQHDKNRGAPAARNTGIQASESEFIALLDDDDAWKVEKLERQIEIFSRLSDNYGLVYTGHSIVRDGELVKSVTPKLSGEVFEELLYRNFIPSPTPLIRRSCFSNVGYFDTSFRSAQDRDMWTRIAKKYKIRVISKPLALSYKSHNDRISKDMETKIAGKKSFIDKYRDYLESHPRALARHFKQLGIFYMYASQPYEAKKYFSKSLENNKSEMITFSYYLSTYLPESICELLFKYHRSFLE